MRFFNVPYRLFALAIVTSVILVACLWIAIVNLPLIKALDDRGVNVEAEIVWVGAPYRNWLGRQNNSGGLRQDIVYAFRTEQGALIEGSVNKKKRYATGLTLGRKFSVKYLPDRPHVYHSDLFKGYAGVGMIKALLIMATVTGMIVAYLWLRMPREWRGPSLRPIVSFGHKEWWDGTS